MKLSSAACVLILVGPAAAAGDERAPVAATLPRPDSPAGSMLLIATGPAYYNLYGISFGGAQLELETGREYRHVVLTGTVSGFVGAERDALVVGHLSAGFHAQYQGGWVRTGVAMEFGEWFVHRVAGKFGKYDYRAFAPVIDTTIALIPSLTFVFIRRSTASLLITTKVRFEIGSAGGFILGACSLVGAQF